jgi:hypothetical protein
MKKGSLVTRLSLASLQACCQAVGEVTVAVRIFVFALGSHGPDEQAIRSFCSAKISPWRRHLSVRRGKCNVGEIRKLISR